MHSLPIVEEISSAQVKLHDGPLNARTLRAVEALRTTSPQERVMDSAFNYVANLLLSGGAKHTIRFSEVTTAQDWKAVRALRQRWYPVLLPYLSDVLDADGSDRHDRHSFVYAAFLDDRAIATIRATSYPYETLDYLDEARLAGYLGQNWKTEYIEWGRLLVDPQYAKMRLTQGLITYAGLRLVTLTPYRGFFGYTKKEVRNLLDKFPIGDEPLRFKIPSRGNHDYLLLRGDFKQTVVHEFPKWVRKIVSRFSANRTIRTPVRAH